MVDDDEETQKKKIALLKKVGEARKAACIADDEDLDLRFFYVTKADGNVPGKQLAQIFNLGDGKGLKVVVANIPTEKKALYKTDDDCTEEGLTKIVNAIVDDKIEMVGMKE